MSVMHLMIDPSVPFDDAKDTLRLAQIAVQSIYGDQRAEFEAPVASDPVSRLFIVDVRQKAGRTLALVFAGYLRCEFGPEKVRVEHAVGQVADEVTVS